MNQLIQTAYVNLTAFVAQTGTPSGAGSSGQSSQSQSPLPSPFIIMLLALAFMFFWMNRQQKKQRQAREKMLEAIKTGDDVVVAGIHGIVANTKDKTLMVKIADNVKIEVNRSAVEVVPGKEADAAVKK